MKPSKFSEAYSSESGFNNNTVMVRYVPKKGKAVAFLNSIHDDKVGDDGVKRKPEIIRYYNRSREQNNRKKAGVNMMDQRMRTYTRKWPMVLWLNILGVATLNACTTFAALHHITSWLHGVCPHDPVHDACSPRGWPEFVMPYMRRCREDTPQLHKLSCSECMHWENVQRNASRCWNCWV